MKYSEWYPCASLLNLKPIYYYLRKNDSDWKKLGGSVYNCKDNWYSRKTKFFNKVGDWTFNVLTFVVK